MARVAAIGLDAAEWPFVDELLSVGLMPNLAELRTRSAECRLHNVAEYRSELPYTQFLTGKDAKANQYWSTVHFDPSTYGVKTVGALKARPFYALGDETKVIAFDTPHSVLAEDVDGIQVTGWGSHSAQYPRASKPTGLLGEIDRVFGPHPAFDDDSEPGWYEPDFLENLTDALLTGAARRIDVVSWLDDRLPDWDFLLTVMSEPHSAGHHMWHGVDESHPACRSPTAALARERLVDVYRAVDAAVGRFAAIAGDDAALVVFALHGMQPNENDLPSTVLLPELLHRLRFRRALLRDPDQRKWRAAGMPPLEPPRHERWLSHMHKQYAGRLRDDPKAAVRRMMPPPLLDFARRATGRPVRPPLGVLDWPTPPELELPPEQIEPLSESLEWQIPGLYRRFWPKMPAFVLPTFSDAHVRINLRGRETHGIVDVGDYRRAGEEVLQEVQRCTNPRTGRPVLEDVLWMREDDPLDPHGPDSDLVLFWKEPVDAFEHPDAGLVGPFPFMRTGEHSSNGFAFVSGPGIEPGDLGERSAFDVPPTILQLLGHEPPSDMHGEAFVRRAAVS